MKGACQTSREWFGRATAHCRPWAAGVLVLAFLGRPAAASDPPAVERYRKEVRPILAKYLFNDPSMNPVRNLNECGLSSL